MPQKWNTQGKRGKMTVRGAKEMGKSSTTILIKENDVEELNYKNLKLMSSYQKTGEKKLVAFN